MKPFNYQDLELAYHNLKKAVSYLNRIMIANNENWKEFEFETARASLIHHYEIAFELCIHAMKDYMENQLKIETVNYSTKDIFRVAVEHKMINNLNRWFEYLGVRDVTRVNNTEDIDEVFPKIQMFIIYAEEFIFGMKKRLV